MFFSFLKDATASAFHNIVQQKHEKYEKTVFHEKSIFSWPLSKQFSVFAKNEKVVLRVTAHPKSTEIRNILCFS